MKVGRIAFGDGRPKGGVTMSRAQLEGIRATYRAGVFTERERILALLNADKEHLDERGVAYVNWVIERIENEEPSQ